MQIEKDWQIIESQGQQLENLHQQFIEQRDENLHNQRLVKRLQEDLKKQQQEHVAGDITDEDSLEQHSGDEQHVPHSNTGVLDETVLKRQPRISISDSSKLLSGSVKTEEDDSSVLGQPKLSIDSDNKITLRFSNELSLIHI